MFLTVSSRQLTAEEKASLLCLQKLMARETGQWKMTKREKWRIKGEEVKAESESGNEK